MNEMKTLEKLVKEHGLVVFPVNPEKKTPHTPNGFKDATADWEKIVEWQSQYPNCGWGMPTGERTGIVVIDKDLKNDGPDNWESLVEENEPTQKTVKVQTQSGGNHEYFRMNGTDIRNSAGKLAEGVDVRGTGGYVVIPPTGGYQFIVSFDEANIAPVPDWLESLLGKPKRKNHTAGEAIRVGRIDRTVEDGTRNDTLFQRGRKLFEAGLTNVEIRGALREFRNTYVEDGDEPIDDEELERILHSAITANEEKLAEEESFIDRLRKELRQLWEPQARELEVFTLKDTTKTIPPKEYLINPMLQTEKGILIAGKGGSNKTNIAIMMGLHIAAGKRLFGWKVKQMPVVYFNYELDENEMLHRVAQARKGHRISEDAPFYWTNEITPISHMEGAAMVGNLVDKLGAGLFIVDPLADAMGGLSDSRDEDVKKVMGHLKAIRRMTGAASIVLHHFNRKGTWRGSSVMDGSVELLMEAFQQEEGFVTFKTTKRRGKPFMMPNLEIDFKVGEDDEAYAFTIRRTDKTFEPEGRGTKTKVIYDLIIVDVMGELPRNDDGWVSSVDLINHFAPIWEVTPKTIRTRLNEAVSRGCLDKEAERGRPTLYRIAKEE